ncbi:prolyl-tRNA synthetase associated domain-containing protein [bacterium]|nr:prolyl-tRNA synthetase associated domain-containing protein [bacterium]NCQ54779.1 prolyl-tRNA synthetase associated domain-containing protein [Candidatus Parcubacteria bacterium]NCS68032.1 prolyl-tRNA synthetase associated domain-containing protein [Candidatus Peregrinibacteria bacterium]NCS95769.1 prolyl-tRNA synthetase associated domain-containing protein [bacterium]
MSFEKTLENVLKAEGLDFEIITHQAFFTVEATLGEYARMGIPENKSLFLRDEKKKRFFLVVMAGEKRADLKSLAEEFGEKRLSFCSEAILAEKLQTTPGAVSPFGLILDSAENIEVLFDEDLLSDEHIGFHPNLNTQTWKMKTTDFRKFLASRPQALNFKPL